ncbi:MAG TPA: efflux transporter outer membrane subunit [Myxococcales bacterium]|nr:efflux transporter outer membrane subunit [Myxococcales bacterium]
MTTIALVKTRSAASAGALSLLLALTGCAAGPRYVKPPAPLNAGWAEKDDARLTTQALPDTAWWRAFGDETLDRLIQLAYHQNLPLRVAGVRIMEARAQLGIAVGRQYPQVQAAFGSATAIQISEHQANIPGFDRNFWDYQVGFDASWELDFWGKYRKDVQAAGGAYLATVADYDDALVTLTAEVARTYTVIRTFEALIAQADSNVTLQQEGLRIAQSRFRNGATSELDVAQATTLLESTRQTVPTLRSGLQQAQNALSTLLGQPTGSLTAMLGPRTGIPAAPAQVSISVPAEMLRRRPDIRSAELTAISQSARVGVAKADLYPRFTLFGRIGTQASSATQPFTGQEGSAGNLFGPGSLYYLFGPRINWTILDYGRTKNNIRAQDARLEQLLIGYQSSVLKAAQEVEDGLAGFLRAQEAEVFARNAATSAARSAQLAYVQYREGAVDYQRVLDAQRSLLQEENTLVRTRSSIATNLISVYKALGGGWEMRRGQPFVPDSTQAEMKKRTNWGDYLSNPPTVKVDHVISNPR